jgi:glucosamine--fructose-6-phosphate aminotransferase (isomerizing)
MERHDAMEGHDAMSDPHDAMTAAPSAMATTMERMPEDLTRILKDWDPVRAGAARIAGRRVFVVGTGTSWHAANQGAYFLRQARVEAWAVQAADAALGGPRPRADDALVVLTHRGTKRYTSEVLARAGEVGVPAVVIGGQNAPGIDIETVPQETAGTFTASHLGALARLAQLAVTLGAELGEIEAIPKAVGVALGASRAVEVPERGLDFVGTGPNAWTAAEGALKVREAAHVFAAGWATEQLMHGPAWALGPRDALVCLDGGGPGAIRLTELAGAVEAQGARVHRFAAPELGEALSVFPLTVAVQRIALDFSRQLGTDPDKVRPTEWGGIEL